YLLATPRHLERADLRRVARRVFLEVVANVPHGAVIVGIERRGRVVLPTQRVRLRGLAYREDGFRERELAERIVGLPAGKALSCEVFRTAERVSDTDVPELVDRAARHPPVVAVAEIGSLLIERDVATLLVHPELVPAYAATTRRRSDRVRSQNRFVVAESSVDEARHDLVALRV